MGSYQVFNGFTKELNEQQEEIVRSSDRVVLCIAGAGTGKTKTITHRVAHIVANGVDPSEILMLTFTNKAAQEMMSRARLLLPQHLHNLVTRMWGGTFHHVASRVLRKFADKLGLKKGFTIIDREDQKTIIKDILEDADKRLPRAQSVVEIYSLSVNTTEKISHIIRKYYPHFEIYTGPLSKVIDRYNIFKKERSLVDFDDLLLNWYILLRDHRDVLSWHKEKFKHVLVDELQDTNKLQGEIIKSICEEPPTNLFGVGDEMQSIYSFRGATINNILNFQAVYKDCVIRKLEINYRSSPSILRLANKIIEASDNHYKKVLRATRNDVEKPSLFVCKDTKDQASFIAEKILELKNRCNLSDCAILYRAHHHSIDIQLQLQAMDIPFEVRSGLRFFELSHIKDILSFARIISNPLDELSFKRAVRLFEGIGRAAADKLWQAVVASGSITESLLQVRLTKTARESVKQFLKLITESSVIKSPKEVISFIHRRFYKEILRSIFEDYRKRNDDINAFIDFSVRFKSVPEMLNELALSSYVASERFGEQGGDRVICSTIHQAKGLEWKNVFIITLVEGKFPDARCKTEEELQEERRLFYVSCTRAKERLFFVMPSVSFEYGDYKINKPSPFLDEVDSGLFDKFYVEFPDE